MQYFYLVDLFQTFCNPSTLILFSTLDRYRRNGFYNPLYSGNAWWLREGAPPASEATSGSVPSPEHEMQLAKLQNSKKSVQGERQYGPWTGQIPPWGRRSPHETSSRQVSNSSQISHKNGTLTIIQYETQG